MIHVNVLTSLFVKITHNYDCAGSGAIDALSSTKSIKMCCNIKKVSVKKWTILIHQPYQAVAYLKVMILGWQTRTQSIPTRVEKYRNRIEHLIDPMTIKLMMIVSKIVKLQFFVSLLIFTERTNLHKFNAFQ
jgi:hypothetical protein